MMQITRAEIIAWTLPIHQLLTVPPASLNFAIRAVSLMLELTITSASAVKPRYAAMVDCLTDITMINHKKAPRPLICCNAMFHFR